MQRSGSAFVDQGQRLFDDGFTASVTIILNGVNAFMYQLMLLPLYGQIALQKTVVCTSNDVFALFDATGTKIRLGRPDLQDASDVATGICTSAFLAGKLDALMEDKSKTDIAKATSSMARRTSSSSSSRVMLGDTGAASSPLSQKSASILHLLNGNKPFSMKGVSDSVNGVMGNLGEKPKTMVDRMENNRFVAQLGNLMGSMWLGNQIHFVDSMITYLIGVVSGMSDMAQVFASNLLC